MAKLLADLRALQECREEVLLSEAEYNLQREAVKKRCNAPADVPHDASNNLEAAVQALTKVASALVANVATPAVQQRPSQSTSTHKPSPLPCTSTAQASPLQPVSTASNAVIADSPLFKNWTGLKRGKITVETKGGHVVELDGQRVKKKQKTLIYNCSQCTFGCNNPGGLASHKKFKHPVQAGPGPGSMSFLECYNAKMQAEVFCRYIATTCIDKARDAMDFTSPEKHWIQKKDDKPKTNSNKGAEKRISRTWQFKRKMILEVEKMAAMLPKEADQATSFVAIMCNIARRQITDWKRVRTIIFKNANGIKRNNMKACKLRKGRFPACEAVIFEEFKDVRAKGKQVEPKCLRQRMR